MSEFINDTTLDVIMRGLIKYKLIRRANADLIGQELRRINTIAVHGYPQTTAFAEYERTPFERKVKRVFTHQAVCAYLNNVERVEAGYADMEREVEGILLVRRLLTKNMDAMLRDGYSADDADQITTEQLSEDDRETYMIRSRAEREAAAAEVMRQRMEAERAEDDDSDEDEWEDIEDDDEDDEFNAVNDAM